MQTRKFQMDKNKKITFTQKELIALLDSVYNDGYNDGQDVGFTWYPPYHQSAARSGWASALYPANNSVSTLSSSSAVMTLPSLPKTNNCMEWKPHVKT